MFPDRLAHVAGQLLPTGALVCALTIGVGVQICVAAEETQTAQGTETVSPLERLQKRSADERWQEARDEFFPTKTAEATNESGDFSLSSTPTVVKPEILDISTTQIISPFPAATESDVAVPLFDVFSQQTRALLQETSGQPNANSAAKPFPAEGAQRLPAPAKNQPVPDPYQASRLEVTEKKTTEKKTTVPEVPPVPEPVSMGQLRIASVDAKTRNSVKVTAQSALRSIAEIQPYHDYAPLLQSGRSLGGLPSNVASAGPEVLRLPVQGEIERVAPTTHYHWMASNLTHDPLYFEDVALERYGHTYSPLVQPLVSVSKFGLQLAGLPYQMALNPVWCEQYPLGYYRPGDCAPFLRYRVPFNKEAAVTSAGIYTGLFFLFP